jgi:hypothetical protein
MTVNLGTLHERLIDAQLAGADRLEPVTVRDADGTTFDVVDLTVTDGLVQIAVARATT